jgi:hypothetical protein
VGKDVLLFQLGELTAQEMQKLLKGYTDLPDELGPSDYEVTLLLLDGERVVAQQYSLRNEGEIFLKGEEGG